MKTTHPVFDTFRKKGVFITAQLLWIGLIVVAVQVASAQRRPMPLTFNPATDIVLNCDSSTHTSSTGVQLVKDAAASNGKAILFGAGASPQAQPHPQVYTEFTFSAPAGCYRVWLRGKSDKDAYTDSVWLQVDDQITTARGSVQMGNWRDIHPAGTYAWAGNGANPISVALKYSGEHKLRIQPRQVPHSIDQIWFSRQQRHIPDTDQAIGF